MHATWDGAEVKVASGGSAKCETQPQHFDWPSKDVRKTFYSYRLARCLELVNRHVH